MNRKKNLLSFVLILSLLSTAFSGCGGSADQALTFSQLISQADKYNGKTVTLEAFYFSGFEISAISESVGLSSGDWRMVPIGTLVWVEGGISQESQNKLYTQTLSPSGYTERLGKLKITGKFETGGRYGHLGAYLYQLKIAAAELLEWSPPPAATTIANTTVAEPVATTNPPIFNLTDAQIAARKVAEDFIRNSSTFRFDGIEGSIKLVETDPGPTSAFRSWSYTFEFQTRHPGHGDRTGQFLAQVITTHNAKILVNLEKDTAVMMAICDNAWDMLREKDLPVNVSGIVVSVGDTTPPGGPVDAPRIFVYRILREEGIFVNVSYTAYPPSPAGDTARAKITLDFYNGDVRVGDKMEARGTLDKETGTVIVAEQGDFIKTSLHKATVLGVVVSIRETTPIDSPGNAPGQYVYELLREDGTFVNVGYTAQEGVALSLYNEAIQAGDYMKASGTYDKSTNMIVAAAQGDMIKTYDHNPVRIKAVWE